MPLSQAEKAVSGKERPAGMRFIMLAVLIDMISIGLIIPFQLVFTCWGPMQQLFGTTAISAIAWRNIFLAGLGMLLLIELEKLLMRHLVRGETARIRAMS